MTAVLLTLRQRGHALTEMIAVSAVLVPLFLLMPVIGKFFDINQAAQLAARYVGLEAAQYNPGNQGFQAEDTIAQQVRLHFFGRSDLPVQTYDGSNPDDPQIQNPSWGAPDNPNVRSSLISQPSTNIQVAYGPLGDGGSQYNGLVPLSAASNPFQNKAAQVQGALGLDAGGVHHNQIQVTIPALSANIKSLGPLLNTTDLTFKKNSAVLVGDWAASNAGDVQGRLNNPTIVPGTGKTSLADRAEALTRYTEGPNCYGVCIPGPVPQFGYPYMGPDTVPADRLR